MKAEDVYSRVKQHFINHEHKMLNKYIFRKDWESDYFCVSSSGYCVEVEVKVSKSDFRADFEKPKHAILKAVKEGKKHHLQYWGLGTIYSDDIIIEDGKQRHARYECSHIKILDLLTEPFPNKFWYAMPEGMISAKDVPAYAGLIYVSEDGYELVKDAPFIHKRKLHLPDLLFDKYRWGYANQANEIERLKFENWQLNERIKNLTLQES